MARGGTSRAALAWTVIASRNSNHHCGADEGDGGDGGRCSDRDGERAPLPPDGEPEQPDPGRHLRQQHERPGGRAADAEHDRQGDEEVDVAEVELGEGRREEQQQGGPAAGEYEEDDGFRPVQRPATIGHGMRWSTAETWASGGG